MNLTPYITTLREDLTTAASAGDEQTRRAATVLSAALEPAARLAIMNALSDLAAEVTAVLDDHVVDVRLDGRDVQVVVTRTTPQGDDMPPPPPPPPPMGDATGDISRITLRLINEMKAKAEQAASQQGVSLNTWLTQVVHGALHGQQSSGWSGGWPGPWGGQWRGDWRGRGHGGPHGGHGRGRGHGEGGGRVRGWVQG